MHARIPMVMPDEANAEEAAYWERYSATFMECGAREREHAHQLIKQAETSEGIAAVFADNRSAALNGERPMERGVVGELLAAKAGVGRAPRDGDTFVRANGEPAVYRERTRNRPMDLRRRRGGFRFTPKPVEGWKRPPFASPKLTDPFS